MTKQFERDFLAADLAAAKALLKERSRDEDPIGHFQFSQRVEALESTLARHLDEREKTAEIAIYFQGRPVQGIRGIAADFASKSLAEFQNIVSNLYAATDGLLGARGPIPQRERSQLLVTDVARGSFGFVLEQAEAPDLIESALKNIVFQAVDLVSNTASPDDGIFANTIDSIDTRVLSSLRNFFKILGEAQASVRMVDQVHNRHLADEDITRARNRIESATIEEVEETKIGKLYIMPDDRRFEFHPGDQMDSIKGRVTIPCMDALTNGGREVIPGFIGPTIQINLRKRIIISEGNTTRSSYILVSVQTLA